jgi:hypothetical protein
MNKYKSFDDSFNNHFIKTDLCWIWTGSIHKSGYGRFNYDCTRYAAHRVAYTLNYGAIPLGMIVCHRCDNPKCVRPDHLFLGTHSDNSKDAYLKGKLDHIKKYAFEKGHASYGSKGPRGPYKPRKRQLR